MWLSKWAPGSINQSLDPERLCVVTDVDCGPRICAVQSYLAAVFVDAADWNEVGAAKL